MYPGLLYEYESVLLGHKNSVSNYFFSSDEDRNEKAALYVVRFAISYYLNWSPEKAVDLLTWDIIKLLKLEGIMKYINFPPELDEKDNAYIIKGKLYPNLVRLNEKEITLKVYKRILSKDLYKFPKEYLSSDYAGKIRAVICMQYMLSQFTSFGSAKEMYKFFATSGGAKLLKRYRLNVICAALFDHPIDFLHYSLPESSKDEYWYRYYRFRIANNEQIRKMKKQGTFVV